MSNVDRKSRSVICFAALHPFRMSGKEGVKKDAFSF